ncbi:hypothetical protein GCM10011371_27050 [Novosphingobium marinum]|uniref:Uncharacterized protein n=1 Tax=Novosphingobium marinum TaxID=1514948 RepID=A0A7Y9XU73_9SPHN|nr:hypothetical protein [Novosphingobium marinum]GGC38237.1 hypothetical protein GCM10011371_27050 [Novosphingobium marinum]
MYEHILATFVALDEAEALVRIEELYSATTLADDLCGHSATRPTSAAAAAKAPTRGSAAAAAAAAEAVLGEAIASAVASESIISSETILSGIERIETLFSDTIPLVASPATTPSVKTHLLE